MRRPALILVLTLLIGAIGCRNGADSHDEAGHSHGPGGHSHDDGDHTHASAADDRPTVSVTQWTERTELFMEFPVFVAGQTGRAAVHVTDLVDFSPLADGEVVVSLQSDFGQLAEFRGGPSAPGIFGVDMDLERTGLYRMTVRIESASFEDVHLLDAVTVHERGAALPAPAGDDEGAIAFLKEQQWTLDFGTARAEARALRASFAVPAVVHPRAGGEALLATPVPGRVDLTSDVPYPGSSVRAGQIVARIAPRSDSLRDVAALRAALVEAEQAHGLASAERDRVQRLVEARALPSRRFDEAQAALLASDARLAAARERWDRFESWSRSGDLGREGAVTVRAPFDGVVTAVDFAPGAVVDENQILLRIVDPDQVHVVGTVPESNAELLRTVDGGELVVDQAPAIPLSRPLALGRVIEPVTRTTEVRFAFDNREARLQIGQSATLRLYTGDESTGTAVPESAIVDDAGQPAVFVQTGGESFERRGVRLGSRTGGWVHVVDGVEPGEHVVSRGAYLVRLASMSSQVPAHGHVH